MRIAFVGKGGSGKTTLASLLAEYLEFRNQKILAIDGDINQNLGDALGFPEDVLSQLVPMGSDPSALYEFVRGQNPFLHERICLVKTSPPGPGSGFIRLSEDSNPVLDRYAYRRGSLQFIATGGFSNTDIGTHCYHSKTGAIELFLNHLLDAPEEHVIVDMTAGADVFASGLFTRFDLTVLVVEPTLASLSVLDQYKSYASAFDVRTIVIGNKVMNSEDRAFIESRSSSPVAGFMEFSPFIRARDKGERRAIGLLEPENKFLLDQIVAIGASVSRDWKTYWRQAVYFHLKNAESWANQMTGRDLGEQVREDFLGTICA